MVLGGNIWRKPKRRKKTIQEKQESREASCSTATYAVLSAHRCSSSPPSYVRVATPKHQHCDISDLLSQETSPAQLLWLQPAPHEDQTAWEPHERGGCCSSSSQELSGSSWQPPFTTCDCCTCEEILPDPRIEFVNKEIENRGRGGGGS